MQKLFSLLWRLSILALPWQTRWIFIDGKIGTFPWEQGTVSFYASWVPLLATVAVAIVLQLKKRSRGPEACPERSRGIQRSSGEKAEGLELRAESQAGSGTQPSGTAVATARTSALSLFPINNTTIEQYNNRTIQQSTPTIKESKSQKKPILLKVALALILIASIFTASLPATLVWWAYALVIGGFVWALGALRVPRASIAAWIVIATLPHAGYGIQQFFAQDLSGNTIFGIADHHPWVSGTSVIEHGLYRVLRAYGGLPHPNILGGWIAVSLSLLPALVRSARTKLATYGWLASGFILVAALVYTFSRGAWIASALAFAAGALIAFNASRERGDRQAVALLVVVCVMVTGFGMWSQWDHVVSRAQASEHLEAWSLLTRTQSFVQGWHAFLHRPLAGWGPGAGDVGIVEVRKGTAWTGIAPEPPHAAPAAFVLETGILGILAAIMLLGALLLEFGIWNLVAFNAMEFGKRRHRASGIGQFAGIDNDRGGRSRIKRLLSRLSTLDSRLPLIVALIVIACTDHYLWTLWPGVALLGLAVAVCLSPEKNKLTANNLTSITRNVIVNLEGEKRLNFGESLVAYFR